MNTSTILFEDNPLILETRNLDVFINNKLVCKNLNLQISAHDRWGMIGVNGIGKTTLLHTLAGLREPKSGEIFFKGKNIASLTRRNVAQNIGVLLQHDTQAFPSTVLETALIGRHPFLQSWQWETREDIRLAQQALSHVDLSDMANRMTNTLSGGENRRLNLATLLTQNPLLYLLDEPTNHLDLHHQISILSMLSKKIETEKRTAIMILHDLNLVQRYCDYVLLLFSNGETLAGPTNKVLTTESLSKLFNHPTIKIDTSRGPVFLPE